MYHFFTCVFSFYYQFSNTHTTENLSEQETIQRYYRQHQEQYEEWLWKTRQQANNRHQQQYQNNPNDWSGWENPNPDDPFYEVKTKIGQFLNRVSYADLFLLTAFGKMIALFLMMILLYTQVKGHWPQCTFCPVGFHLYEFSSLYNLDLWIVLN